MIAGPNGSGKSTLTRELVARGVELGRYINADEIDASLPGPADEERSRRAQALADAARRECLEQGIGFAFETVMSHRSKIEVLREARRRGYAVVIFFVALESPQLNVERVRQRVALGGHPVPEDRIVARYERTMALLPEAISLCDRTVLFDNSYRALEGGPVRLVPVCEVRPQRETSAYAIVDRRQRPQWVQKVLERLEYYPPSGA
jgi:predicted ABC-type ATPase